ncbi:hypothetical protein CMQ_215 [Grosmannia clavigera kw1407]|uniref:Uncharacterized protein n=1 Tax=Grosmannia clavigera (strain kw1407 / UAMH 11150) TaxID=655863 RepID=F0XR49_GROCL|nr:uncharacterized protein CMQ_215 [Grosmannia clavigera kw1407]EFW99897.1 hypothetical protein CMQ_215 [Grosmannia clavigera kw1407]
MAREEDWLVSRAGGKGKTSGDIADLAGVGGAHARHALQLQGGVVAEEHLRGVLDGAPPGIDKLLDKDLSVDAVGLLAEDGAEDNGDAVVARLDVDGLLLAVVDGHDLTTLADALRRLFGRVLGRLFLELVVLGEGGLERGGHHVALEQGDLVDQGRAGLRLGRKLVEVDNDGKLEAGLGLHNVRAVLALQHLLGAILDQVVIASQENGDLNFRLGLGRGDVEQHTVKVGHGLVNVCRRCPERMDGRRRQQLVGREKGGEGDGWIGGEPYPENLSVSTVWMRTFW